MWKFIFAAVVWMAAVVPGAAQTRLPPVGGPGGGDFVETCGGGVNHFMIGVTGRTGDWIDAIMPICTRYDRDTKTLSAPYTLNQHGGTGGSPNSAHCAPGMVVKGLEIDKIDNGGQILVKYVRLLCQTLPIPPGDRHVLTAEFFGVETSPYSNHSVTLTCPEFEAASGLSGASGDYVDRLGLYCQSAPFDMGRPVVPPRAPRAKDSTTAGPILSREPSHTRTPTTPPISLGIYLAPRIATTDGGTERLDFCQQYGSACGKPAADAFCKSKGHGGSASSEIDPDIGRTMIIGNGAICADPTCDGFKKIQCSP